MKLPLVSLMSQKFVSGHTLRFRADLCLKILDFLLERGNFIFCLLPENKSQYRYNKSNCSHDLNVSF